MGNINRRIATMFIGLAGVAVAGGTVAWTSATFEQAPASVTHYAGEDDMHWRPRSGALPDPAEDVVTTPPPEEDDDMHW